MKLVSTFGGMALAMGACSTSPYRVYSPDMSVLTQERMEQAVFLDSNGNYPDLPGGEMWHPVGTAGRFGCMEKVERVLFEDDYVETHQRLSDCEGVRNPEADFPYPSWSWDVSMLTDKEAASIEMQPWNKRHKRLSALDCKVARGASARCDCFYEQDAAEAISKLESAHKRLGECERENARDN